MCQNDPPALCSPPTFRVVVLVFVLSLVIYMICQHALKHKHMYNVIQNYICHGL